MVLITDEMVEEMLFQMEDTVFRIALTTLETAPLIAFHTLEIMDFIVFITLEIKLEIASQTDVTTLEIVLNVVEIAV